MGKTEFKIGDFALLENTYIVEIEIIPIIKVHPYDIRVRVFAFDNYSFWVPSTSLKPLENQIAPKVLYGKITNK